VDIQNYHMWLSAALLLAAAELFGGQFALLALALACLAGAGMAYFTNAGLVGQLFAAAVTSVALMPLVVWHIRRVMRAGRYGVTGEGAERGAEATIIEQAGRLGVKYRGDFLPARLEHEGQLSAGDRVRIVRIEGISAIVEPAAQG
jgi:membrane protein implicated in regulation of membrane protease activity